jgi:rhodanese-related sulfurtransferase
MQNLLLFVSHQWFAIAIFVILLLATLWLETQGKVGGCQRLTPQQVVNMLNREQAVIFDTRDKPAFLQGHIAHAQHLPESSLEKKELSNYKDKPVILVCSTGTQATKLGTKLKKKGFQRLYFLQGGIAAWNEADLPLIN